MPSRILQKHGPFLLLLLAVSAVRFWLMSTLELNEDEAYYWEWSRNLALSYYDQGPGVALAMALALWPPSGVNKRLPSAATDAFRGRSWRRH